MQFKVESGRGQLGDTLPPSLEKFVKVLGGLPEGKLLDARALAVRAGYSLKMVHYHTMHPALQDCKLKLNGSTVYYGHPRTVAQARKEFCA